MTLALRLGMTLGELNRRLTWAEFIDWVGYFELEANPKAARSPEDEALDEEVNAERMKVFFEGMEIREAKGNPQ